jgi:translation initiation factor IF-1
MSENETLNNVELELDELDAVSGGAGTTYYDPEVDGKIAAILSPVSFQVRASRNGALITCSLSRQMKAHCPHPINVGDRVRIQLQSGDLSRGRIVSIS